MSKPRNKKNDSLVAYKLSSLLISNHSSPLDIEKSTLYFTLSNETERQSFSIRIGIIGAVLNLDDYIQFYENPSLTLPSPIKFINEPLTNPNIFHFLTGYDNTTKVQTYYSSQNKFEMEKYSVAQINKMIETEGIEIKYKGRIYTKENKGDFPNLKKYEYNIPLDNTVISWLCNTSKYKFDLMKGINLDNLYSEIIVKKNNLFGESYINTSCLNLSPEKFLTDYGTSIAYQYKLGVFDEYYIPYQKCIDLLDIVLGRNNYAFFITPAIIINFPQNNMQIGDYTYTFKEKKIDGNTKKQVVVKSVTEAKVIRGVYIDVLGNFKIGQIVCDPAFADTKSVATAEELLKKELLKSVWRVFKSVDKGSKSHMDNLKTKLDVYVGEKYKDINLINTDRTIPEITMTNIAGLIEEAGNKAKEEVENEENKELEKEENEELNERKRIKEIEYNDVNVREPENKRKDMQKVSLVEEENEKEEEKERENEQINEGNNDIQNVNTGLENEQENKMDEDEIDNLLDEI